MTRLRPQKKGDSMAEKVMIKGSSRGYKHGAIFHLVDGRRWKQTSYQHSYRYQYRPEALLEPSGRRWRLKIDGMSDWVEVKQARREDT